MTPASSLSKSQTFSSASPIAMPPMAGKRMPRLKNKLELSRKAADPQTQQQYIRTHTKLYNCIIYYIRYMYVIEIQTHKSFQSIGVLGAGRWSMSFSPGPTVTLLSSDISKNTSFVFSSNHDWFYKSHSTVWSQTIRYVCFSNSSEILPYLFSCCSNNIIFRLIVNVRVTAFCCLNSRNDWFFKQVF